MLEKIDELLVEAANFNSSNKDEIELFRIKFSGKKGILNDIFAQFKDVPNEQKKEFGQKINTLKQAVETKLEELKNATASNIILEKEDLFLRWISFIQKIILARLLSAEELGVFFNSQTRIIF